MGQDVLHSADRLLRGEAVFTCNRHHLTHCSAHRRHHSVHWGHLRTLTLLSAGVDLDHDLQPVWAGSSHPLPRAVDPIGQFDRVHGLQQVEVGNACSTEVAVRTWGRLRAHLHSPRSLFTLFFWRWPIKCHLMSGHEPKIWDRQRVSGGGGVEPQRLGPT